MMNLIPGEMLIILFGFHESDLENQRNFLSRKPKKKKKNGSMKVVWRIRETFLETRTLPCVMTILMLMESHVLHVLPIQSFKFYVWVN